MKLHMKKFSILALLFLVNSARAMEIEMTVFADKSDSISNPTNKSVLKTVFTKMSDREVAIPVHKSDSVAKRTHNLDLIIIPSDRSSAVVDKSKPVKIYHSPDLQYKPTPKYTPAAAVYSKKDINDLAFLHKEEGIEFAYRDYKWVTDIAKRTPVFCLKMNGIKMKARTAFPTIAHGIDCLQSNAYPVH